jgi:pSer/pThr/pTyr-binding forkhead associated (FHA) protein
MRTVLTIGREPDNDLVINLPIVSGRHARVTWEGVPGQAVLEDLGSSNGTAIGQVDRKITRATITASDLVYFGNHPVPGAELLGWVDPSLAPTLLLHGPEMVIGRDPGCHRVIDRPTISGRHARLKRTGERIILEDLGSSNGTFVNGQRVEGSTEVRFGDLIGLGVDSFRLSTGASPVAGTQRMDAIRPPVSHRPSPTLLQVESLPPAPIESAGGGLLHPIALVALLAQAPLLAVVIGMLARGGPAIGPFLLGLAATWFGLSTAVIGLLLDPRRPVGPSGPRDSGFWLTRSLILGGLCVAESVLAGLVVLAMGGLQGSGASAIGLLILASAVGLGAGLVIVLLAPNPAVAWGGLAVAAVALGLFEGGPGSLPRSASVIRLASNASPSRWAFEGLLVNEAAVRTIPEPIYEPARDLAEDYFPAEFDRMGVKADAMALGAMMVGLLGAGAFLVRFSGDDQ